MIGKSAAEAVAGAAINAGLVASAASGSRSKIVASRASGKTREMLSKTKNNPSHGGKDVLDVAVGGAADEVADVIRSNNPSNSRSQ